MSALSGVLKQCWRLKLMELDDYRQASGELEIDGKGDRVRLGYCGTGVRAAVEDRIAVRGDEAGSLLLAVIKGGRIDPARRRLSTSALYGIVQRRAAAAAACARGQPRRTGPAGRPGGGNGGAVPQRA
jgi:hypothetical protein